MDHVLDFEFYKNAIQIEFMMKVIIIIIIQINILNINI